MTQEQDNNQSLPEQTPAPETPAEQAANHTSEISAQAEQAPAVQAEQSAPIESAPEAPAETAPETPATEETQVVAAQEETSTPATDAATDATAADGAAPPSAALTTADAMPLTQVLEALLFSTDMPLNASKLAETCGLDSTKAVKDTIAELNKGYEERQAAYRIEERAGGYQLLTLPQYADYITRLVRKKDEGRLTPAMLETMAIIAYKQPIIRADVEAIRGVGAGEVLRSLMEHNLVKIVGRAEEIGRPMLYGTTRYFLEVFGLASLKDLPKSEQLQEPKSK